MCYTQGSYWSVHEPGCPGAISASSCHFPWDTVQKGFGPFSLRVGVTQLGISGGCQLGGVLVDCSASPGQVTGGGQSSEMKGRGTLCLPSDLQGDEASEEAGVGNIRKGEKIKNTQGPSLLPCILGLFLALIKMSPQTLNTPA